MYFDSGIDGGDRAKSPTFAITIVGIAAIFGVLAIVLVLLKIYWGGLIFGAGGLLMGGFSFARAFTAKGSMRTVLTAIVAVALILSVLGFMLGFKGIL